MNFRAFAVLFVVAFLSSQSSYADQNTIIDVPTLSGDVVIDGVPDEDFWSQARTIEALARR